MIGRLLIDVEYDSYKDSISAREYIPYIIEAIEKAGFKVNGFYDVGGYTTLRTPKSNKKRDVRDVIDSKIPDHKKCPYFDAEDIGGPGSMGIHLRHCSKHGRPLLQCKDALYFVPPKKQKRK